MRIYDCLQRRRKIGCALPALCFFLVFFLSVFPVSAKGDYQVEETQMEVQVSTSASLNIRSGPGTDYKVVGTADSGASLTVTGMTQSEDGIPWYEVETDGEKGFVRSDLVKVVKAAEEAPPPEEQEPEPGEPEEGYGKFYQRPVFIKSAAIIAGIVILLVMLVITLRGLRKDREESDEDEEDYDEAYDADEESYDEDMYEEDTDTAYEDESCYEDAYGDGPYEEDDGPYEEEDDGDEEEDGYEEEAVRGGRNSGRKQASGQRKKSGRKAYILREEDYRVQIDPSFFDDKEPIEQPAMVTGYLERKLIEEAARAHEVEVRDEELHQPGGDMRDKQKELDQAMAKLNELQKEIERLKSQS